MNVAFYDVAKSTTEPVATAAAKFMWAIQDQRGIYEVDHDLRRPRRLDRRVHLDQGAA